jgi:hypothetical protein
MLEWLVVVASGVAESDVVVASGSGIGNVVASGVAESAIVVASK